MRACRFDGMPLENGSASTSSVSVPLDVQTEIYKMLGYLYDIKEKSMEGTPSKRPRLANDSSGSLKTHVQVEPTPQIQQVVSTWVPPREDSCETATQSVPSTPPTATAQVMVKSELDHILQNSLPRMGLSNADTTFGEVHGPRPYEDKWTLMGRMIEELARELEAKHSELAYRLQKDINDVIFKYQLESLKHK
ncbi:unnamed protein product [Cylicostephanus goldi]|uniref:Uncharacterized protein n=1 Tax=Cylicostephanus goldi TaxID=71465 RepID=A0A3P6QPQ4_CYLGO|nr:unnamed protein product [Cylicostephanus goldi]